MHPLPDSAPERDTGAPSLGPLDFRKRIGRHRVPPKKRPACFGRAKDLFQAREVVSGTATADFCRSLPATGEAKAIKSTPPRFALKMIQRGHESISQAFAASALRPPLRARADRRPDHGRSLCTCRPRSPRGPESGPSTPSCRPVSRFTMSFHTIWCVTGARLEARGPDSVATPDTAGLQADAHRPAFHARPSC